MVKEAKVLEYFGPSRSLLVHLAPLWKAATDFICEKLCHNLYEEYSNNWANAAAALTHPEILRVCRSTRCAFQTAIGVPFHFDKMPSSDSDMDTIQNYLRDREHAGRYFVHGGMYATLCLRLCKVVRLAYNTL